jgi:hypothetical protein
MQRPPNNPQNPYYGQTPQNWNGNVPPPQSFVQAGSAFAPGTLPHAVTASSAVIRLIVFLFTFLFGVFFISCMGIGIWFLLTTTEPPKKAFAQFVTYSKEGQSAAAYAMLSSQLQRRFGSVATFEEVFITQTKPELRNYKGLDARKTNMVYSDTRMTGRLSGTRLDFRVEMDVINGEWKIKAFRIGNYQAGNFVKPPPS